MSGELLGCHSWRDSMAGDWAAARDGAQQPSRHRRAPPTQQELSHWRNSGIKASSTQLGLEASPCRAQPKGSRGRVLAPGPLLLVRVSSLPLGEIPQIPVIEGLEGGMEPESTPSARTQPPPPTGLGPHHHTSAPILGMLRAREETWVSAAGLR